MMNTVEIFESFRDVHKLLSKLEHSQNETVSGNITMTEEALSVLKRAVLADIQSGSVYYDKRHPDLESYGELLVKQGAEVTLELTIPRHVYQSWDELLSKQHNRLVMPTNFMIIEDNYYIYSNDDDCPLIRSYKKTLDLIGYLKSVADHENSEISFVYLSRSKLTIDIVYGKQALEYLNVSNFEILTEIMQEPEHSNQKKYILQDILFNMLLQVPQRDRFESLLNRLQDFLIQFEHGYRLFVTSFSFDNVRREYEEKYREYNGKLNTSINDVATKSLATPVSMLFSISNISATSTAASNYAIAVSSVLVSTFIIFLVRSNADSLVAIIDEYTKLFDRLALELIGNASIENDVTELKAKLNKRVTVSQNLNILTMASAIASSVFVVGYMFWLTW